MLHIDPIRQQHEVSNARSQDSGDLWQGHHACKEAATRFAQNGDYRFFRLDPRPETSRSGGLALRQFQKPD